MRPSVRVAAAALLSLALAACVDSPIAAPAAVEEDNLLATSFDELSQEQAQLGDADRGQELGWAALAVRSGVVPSQLDVTNDGEREAYSAFVHAVSWVTPSAARRPGAYRTLVAWRKSGERMQIIMLSTTADEQPVTHPLSMSPVGMGPMTGARAAYYERGPGRASWLGTSGTVQIAEGSAGDACSTAATSQNRGPKGVGCRRLTYNVGFSVGFQPVTATGHAPDLSAPVIQIEAADQPVSGARLMFSCAAPSSKKGC
jgi:hypothetical protein